MWSASTGAVFCTMVALTVLRLSTGTKRYTAARETNEGRVRGVEEEVLPGKFVELFLGVPYAAKPLGKLRFEYPEEPPPWSGVLNATELPAACWQSRVTYITSHYKGDVRLHEDCLYLNIYSPKTGRRDMEVLLWIHGGSNEVGMGAMLTGKVLAAYEELVVVNFNYRLSNLGFLGLGKAGFPGNYGLADQVAAIKWVQKNIHFYNGDPAKVTLGGHSAGALDVSLHMLSEETKGMYRYVLQMSGTSLAYWSTLSPRVEPVYRKEVRNYFRKLGCDSKRPEEVKRCLRSYSASVLTNTEVKRSQWLLIEHPIAVDNVTVMGKPLDMYSRGQAQTLPIMLGFTKDEGGIQAEHYHTVHDELDKTEMLKLLNQFKEVTDDVDNFPTVVLHEYVSYPDPYNSTKLLKSLAQVEGDLAMVIPTLRTAHYLYRQYSKANRDHIYAYSFEFESPTAFDNIPWLAGVPHGRDLFYLFGLPLIGLEGHNFTAGDRNMSETLMQIWGSFIKNGYPSYKKRKIERFESFNSSHQALVRFRNTGRDGVAMETVYKYKQKQYDFWTEVMPAIAMTNRCSINYCDKIEYSRTVVLSIAMLSSFIYFQQIL